MSIESGLFIFLTFCCIITAISGVTDHYFIMEKFLKNRGKNNKLKTTYPKNHENFKHITSFYASAEITRSGCKI